MLMKTARAALALGLGLLGIAVGTAPAGAATGVETAGPVRVAVVVPLVAPANSTGLIDADALEQYTRPFGLLTRQLDAVIGRPVTIAIDPMIIASIRILGSSAPETATTWLDRLESASNQTFALAWADADLTLATQAGSSRVLAPESLDFAVDPALFAPVTEEPTPTPGATETPTPEPVDPTVPTLPSTEDLLAWPYTLTGIAWPREDSVVSADLTAITASDYSSAILSSSNLSFPDGRGAVAEIDGEQVLVSDDEMSEALRTAAHSVIAADQQTALATFDSLAARAATAAGGEQATVIVTLDRTVPLTGSLTSEVLSALAVSSTVDLVPLSQAMGTGPVAATVTDAPQAADRVADVTRMLESEAAVARFASAAADPAAITGERRLAMLALLSVAWGANPTGWPTAVTVYRDTSSDITNAVQIVESSTVNFLAQSAPLGIGVRNDLGQAVTVYVTVRPDTSLLAVEDSRVELVIEPNSQAKADVPVTAISNGVVDITVTLTSATGTPIGSPTRTEINVQAGWETPVVLVIAGLVVVIFAVGILRVILRRRRPVDEGSSE